MSPEDQKLWRALQSLRSVSCWLMTGAHPDDEWNGFLGWLRLGLGVRTVYACSTRGEGGQNALGPERGRMLGALRSREMELAAAEIGLDVAWIGAGAGHGADDPIHDFGFSKSGDDTLAQWGEARLVARLVRLIRDVRPDAVSPTFLDVPGQHGHHRAMTRSTITAIGLAADPAYVLGECDLPAWQVARFYLPAFSGAGGSYDDTVPPPAETIRVDLGEVCALGMSWAQLGEVSRRHHASQGMGRALPDGPRPFSLHLAIGAADASRPMDGLVRTLADLAAEVPAEVPAAAGALMRADAAIGAAVAAFPDRAAVADGTHAALAALDGIVGSLGFDVDRRIARKRRELGVVAALALGIGGRLELPGMLRAGDVARVRVVVDGPAEAVLRVPEGWAVDIAGDLTVPVTQPGFGTTRDGWCSLGGNDVVGASLSWTHGGSVGRCDIDPPAPICVAPAQAVSLSPARSVRRMDSDAPVVLTLIGAEPPGSWPVMARRGDDVTLTPLPGRTDLTPAGSALVQASAAHVGGFAIIAPAEAAVLRCDVAIDEGARVGVIESEVDTTLSWLLQLGFAAAAVDDDMLAHGDLGRFTTLMVGIFAYGQRPALTTHRARILAWVEAGGSLVTFYHRPGDGWNAEGTPPRRLVIGSPSLRWRATDPGAGVVMVRPDHPVLSAPNRIGAADWDGWVRERGLYFAKAWHPDTQALLSIADAEDGPFLGSLLATQVGAGRHVHVALALHHQWAALVPGAFRLLANLAARA